MQEYRQRIRQESVVRADSVVQEDIRGDNAPTNAEVAR